MKQKQAQQILNLQQQVAAMEQEIEQLYAERRRLTGRCWRRVSV